MDELDRRETVLYTHPITLDCCANIAMPVRDATSRFDLFPTLQQLPDYEPGWVRSRLGPPLLDVGPREPARFLTGLSRRELVWQRAR